MAWTGKVAQYCDSVKYAAVTAWAATTSKSAGDVVRQSSVSSDNDERVFVCIVGGTTGSVQPTWDVSRGAKTTDGTVTWQEFTGDPAGNGDLTSVPSWLNGAKSTNVTQGHIIKDNAGTHIFIASIANNNAGTGAEPSWNTAAVGNTTVDGSVTWVYLGTGFSAWQCPHSRIRNMMQQNWAGNGGASIDPTLFYIAAEHAETTANGTSWPSFASMDQPAMLLCVDQTGSLPPVAADLRTTAAVTTTSSSSVVVAGHIKVCYGINFTIGTSAGVAWAVSESLVDKNFESCTFTFGSGTSSGAGYQMANARLVFKDCTWKFANTGQGFNSVKGQIRFINNTFAPTGSVPTLLINETSAAADWSFEGCDLSALSGSTIGSNNSGASSNSFMFSDCKFPATFTPWAFSGSNSATGEKVTFTRCSSGASPLQFLYTERAGTLTASTTIYRGSGASENGVAFSWGILTTSHANSGSTYFDAPPIAKNNTNTGVNVIATMYGIINAASLPTDDDICFDLHYLGSASTDQGTIKSNRVANFLATPSNRSADTSAWDGGATARANTHAYALGDIIKLASNSGRIFFCTTAGTSAGSEPGGYASAVDGGSVTDGSAVFRAGMRFSMAVTATSPQPQQAGLLYAKMRIGKKSTQFYIDPTVTLT